MCQKERNNANKVKKETLVSYCLQIFFKVCLCELLYGFQTRFLKGVRRGLNPILQAQIKVMNFETFLLPSATLLRQGNIFTRVCHSGHGEVSATPPGRQTPPAGIHPHRQTPPGRQTPSPWQTPPSMQTSPVAGRHHHPLPQQANTPLPPPPSRYPMAGRHPTWQIPGRQTPPGMATAADGTHPTGMHSSLIKYIDKQAILSKPRVMHNYHHRTSTNQLK